MGRGLTSSGSGQRLVAGSWVHGSEHSVSIKLWEFTAWLSNWWLLRKDSATWS
jgi:hypothetical protein